MLIFLLACLVPQKKYDALQAELEAANAAATALMAERDVAVANGVTLQAALAAEEAERVTLTAQMTELSARLEAASAEQASLLKDKSKLQASVQDMQAALKELAERRAAAEARVSQFKDMLARFKKLIDAGELEVKIVDGRMVVELATDILFASGKADLSAKGKESLLAVAGILASFADRHYQVEGHTDNVPISSERFPSNWELASARSLTVVKVLIEGGIPAQRLSGASYGEFRPTKDNASPEGKADNRRIEIVMVPDLSDLPGFDELKKIGG